MNAGAGLFYEAAADLIYPMDTVVSSSLLTFVFNACSAVYTMLGSRISPAAMNYTLTGALAAVCVCVCACVCVCVCVCAFA